MNGWIKVPNTKAANTIEADNPNVFDRKLAKGIKKILISPPSSYIIQMIRYKKPGFKTRL